MYYQVPTHEKGAFSPTRKGFALCNPSLADGWAFPLQAFAVGLYFAKKRKSFLAKLN